MYEPISSAQQHENRSPSLLQMALFSRERTAEGTSTDNRDKPLALSAATIDELKAPTAQHLGTDDQ